MSRRILVVDGHPDPNPARFGHALADRYVKGASAARHEVRRIDLAGLGVPVLRTKSEWERGQPCLAIKAAQESVAWAEHLVFLYPLWLGDMPALFKAFLEQVLRPGFAFRPGFGLGAGLLEGRSATIIISMGMPASIYSWWFKAHSVKSLERNILKFVGIKPVRHILFGGVEENPNRRARWLEDLYVLGISGG